MLKEVDPSLLEALDRPVPRYTSYPPAPAWKTLSESTYRSALTRFDQEEAPLSLYLHIPFCRTMCLFCGCSVILNRRDDIQEQYVDALLQEARLLSFQKKHPVTQLHLGGGTPTQLTVSQLTRLMEGLYARFTIAPDAEISIEIDPRNGTDKLPLLKELGFKRVSFGVQDTDPAVQKAIRRHQSYEMTAATVAAARALNFDSINVDLIYGLPLQTSESFAETIRRIIALSPDRIALFSYAKVPWLKPHQKAIPDASLPSTPTKFALYAHARTALIDAGYCPIGMDHFAKQNDELTLAFHENRLQRNFQGYSLKTAETMIGLGVTSIGYVAGTYAQNAKDLPAYYDRLAQGQLPVQKGLVLSEDDLLRRALIQELMCTFKIDKKAFKTTWNRDFDTLFPDTPPLTINTPELFQATPLGSLFIRTIAKHFDAYTHDGQFSKAI